MAIVAFRQADTRVSSLAGTLATMQEGARALRSVLSYLEDAGVPRADGTLTCGPRPGDGIRFQDVAYAYSGSEAEVLRGVTFHLPPRGKLALVGPNGAGKTTIIKLLTRLIRPTRGVITLDGADLALWSEAALHARMGVIFQDFVEYSFSVGRNIGVGDVAHFDDEARWKAAAEKGSADEVIAALPKGFATHLGKWHPDGRELSGGQWQKVALARAFMRETADILVLDEPTAAVDAESEAKLFARFRSLTAERSAVFISHRFSTTRMADTILVLEAGSILERGSHEELVARGGTYARLFTLQAQGYR